MREQAWTVSYYNISAASFGVQPGAPVFSFVLLFMNRGAPDYLKKSDGGAVWSGPGLVALDKGIAKNISSTTLTHDDYAVPFGQRGLMADLEGSKITRTTVGP